MKIFKIGQIAPLKTQDDMRSISDNDDSSSDSQSEFCTAEPFGIK